MDVIEGGEKSEEKFVMKAESGLFGMWKKVEKRRIGIWGNGRRVRVGT